VAQVIAAASELEQLRALNARLVERTRQLETALQSRIVIEQAKGMLAARHGLTVDVAFEALRRAARSHQLRLHDLARRVVDEPATPTVIRQYLPHLD
jgi:AmiR/NasT family two-component response regulator